MAEDPLTIGELGGYTNNQMNKEGLKKLVKKVNEGGGGGGPTYTAGDNIQISTQNVISATDTTYTAGDNIQISAQNVISATDTKYTAGSGIAISDQNVISATGGSGRSDWELVTTNDWITNIVSVDSSNPYVITLLKDCYISYTNSTHTTTFFIGGKGSVLKGLANNSQYGDIIITTGCRGYTNPNKLRIMFKNFFYVDIFTTAPNVSFKDKDYDINTTTLTDSAVTDSTDTYDKKYVADSTNGIRLYVR